MISVIGDIMIDEYLRGTSIRQSPECAEAPVVLITKQESMLGGAGNTALNISHLGVPSNIFCAVASKGAAVSMLECSGIRYETSCNSNNDIIKTRVYSNGVYIARLDNETPVKHDEQMLINKLFDSNPELIVISDYGKGTITNSKAIIDRANALGIKVLVDTKSNLANFAGAFVIKPNLNEFYDWTGIPMPKDHTDAVNRLSPQILSEAFSRMKVDNLIITIGSMGCLHVDSYGSNIYPALPIKAVDVTGAGDTFIAALAVSIYEGNNIKKAIQFANTAASVSVTKKGTQHVERHEI
jgi:D-beta-D-heptose 7-phosphate kinase/D-beta-D-heptose 1-phosphate adenosyltransferase